MSTRPVPAPKGRLRGARQALLTLFARLRFVAILAVIGFVIVEWDTLLAWYEKYTRPAAATAAAAGPDSEYFCPMHPAVVRDDGKEKCPICHMSLAKRKKGEATDAPLPAGVVSRVQLSPYRVVLAGVRTVPVEYQPLAKEVLTVGTVEFDERGLKHVAARYKGRLDKLLANQTGQFVRKGAPLAEVYSPDLVVTVQNLLDARRTGNRDLENVARDRLKLWGVADDQIDTLVQEGKPVTHLTVRSPIDGHVIKKYQTEGRYVDEGSPLYDVADLHTVWVQAQVYEDDLGFLPGDGHDLPPGDRPEVTAVTPAFPGESFPGRLSFIFPHIDQETRTLTVRYELANPGNKLRPGLTATVTLRLGPDRLAALAPKLKRNGNRVLAVPEGAVIDTGSQKVVYRQESPGVFAGVLVELGPRLSGPGGVPYFPVLAGLEPGEQVVAAGSFLIDAETRLNPAAGSIYVSGGSGGKGGSPAAVRPSTPDDEEATVQANLGRLSAADRAAAEAQGTCPVLEGSRLGSMGPPVKLSLAGRTVFLCCQGCEKKALADPARTAARADELRLKKPPAPPPAAPASPAPEEEAEIRAELEKLPPADRALAEAQTFCPKTGERLGSMGVPQKLTVNGRAMFTCCRGCNAAVIANPEKALKRLEELKARPGGPKR